jgi:hypothetical protein
MNYTFAVITKVPKPKDGNVYDAVMVKDWDEFNKEEVYRMAVEEDFDNADEKGIDHINAHIPVFALGEVLILDSPYGREIAGMRRKPSKWFVEVEEFSHLDDAIEKAQEVLKED